FVLNAPAPTEPYPLSLHDALPISAGELFESQCVRARWKGPELVVPVRARPRLSSIGGLHGDIHPSQRRAGPSVGDGAVDETPARSEEHTSELQSLRHLVCRLLLEK